MDTRFQSPIFQVYPEPKFDQFLINPFEYYFGTLKDKYIQMLENFVSWRRIEITRGGKGRTAAHLINPTNINNEYNRLLDFEIEHILYENKQVDFFVMYCYDDSKKNENYVFDNSINAYVQKPNEPMIITRIFIIKNNPKIYVDKTSHRTFEYIKPLLINRMFSNTEYEPLHKIIERAANVKVSTTKTVMPYELKCTNVNDNFNCTTNNDNVPLPTDFNLTQCKYNNKQLSCILQRGNNNDQFYKKYLKYKNKYSSLKNGGMPNKHVMQIITFDNQIFQENRSYINDLIKRWEESPNYGRFSWSSLESGSVKIEITRYQSYIINGMEIYIYLNVDGQYTIIYNPTNYQIK